MRGLFWEVECRSDPELSRRQCSGEIGGFMAHVDVGKTNLLAAVVVTETCHELNDRICLTERKC